MLRICLLAGGVSTEHEVSLRSAMNVRDNLLCLQKSGDSLELFCIGIDKRGNWFWYPDGNFAGQQKNSSLATLLDSPQKEPVSLVRQDGCAWLISVGEGAIKKISQIDLLFPVLHGKNGEDGAVQGLAQLLEIPCVGCGMTSSALCMDKAFTKRVLAHAGFVKMARWVEVRKNQALPDVSSLGLPLFVKPANAGSSVGVVKVERPEQLQSAVAEALQYDDKVLIEEAIVGREIECAVLGNPSGELFCPPPGEIAAKKGTFYSYDEKYAASSVTEVLVPAPNLSPDEINTVCSLAKKIYAELDCRGFSRVDFFYDQRGNWIFNEVNTIPGFTDISMYPKLMAAAGISGTELVLKLLNCAQNLF